MPFFCCLFYYNNMKIVFQQFKNVLSLDKKQRY